MKIKYEFNLLDEDSKSQEEIFRNAPAMYHALWEFSNELRSRIKYPKKEEYSRLSIQVMEEIRELLFENLNANDFTLDLP